MKKTLTALLTALCGVAAAAPLPSGAQLRSTNTVEAEFINLLDFPCPRHKGRECPASCTKATKSIVLSVTKSEDYTKHSRYADDRIKKGETLTIDLVKAIPGQDDADVRAKLTPLQTGDKVRLTIKQYYIEVKGVQSTHRPVTVLEVIPGEDQLPTD